MSLAEWWSWESLQRMGGGGERRVEEGWRGKGALWPRGSKDPYTQSFPIHSSIQCFFIGHSLQMHRQRVPRKTHSLPARSFHSCYLPGGFYKEGG